MGIDLGVHDHARRGMRLLLRSSLMAVMVIAAFGCEARREHETSPESASDSTAASGARRPSARTGGAGARPSSGARHEGGADRDEAESARGKTAATPAAGPNHVRLIQHGCVQFEPQWASIEVGQTLTWHSELAVPVTIHVTAGAFSETEFIVRAGQSLTTGPARAPGAYAIHTEPTACQGAPLGPRGSTPGVTVTAPR